MIQIPYAELALGAARNQAFAEGLAAGASTGRLWARKQDDKRDAAMRLAGHAAQVASTRQPGFQLWNPESGKPPATVNIQTAFGAIAQHTEDRRRVAAMFGIRPGYEASELGAAARRPNEWFDRRLVALRATQPATIIERLLAPGGGPNIAVKAIEFTSPAGARIWLLRGLAIEPPRVVPIATASATASVAPELERDRHYDPDAVEAAAASPRPRGKTPAPRKSTRPRTQTNAATTKTR